MRYAITYLSGGARRAERLDARDAAAAVALVRRAQARADRAFELLSVIALDPPTAPAVEAARKGGAR